jgi:subtilase family serine protease
MGRPEDRSVSSRRAIALALLLSASFAAYVPTAAAEVTLVLAEDFESGAPGWSGDGLWHLSNATGSTSYWYAKENTGNYDTGTRTTGVLLSPMIDLGPATGDRVGLTFIEVVEHEQDCGFERPVVLISVDGGAGFSVLDDRCVFSSSGRVSIDLTPFAGNVVQLGFLWDTHDGGSNAFFGWSIDDVVVSAGRPEGELSPTGVTIQQASGGASITLHVANAGTARVENVKVSYRLFDETGGFRGGSETFITLEPGATGSAFLGTFGIEPGAWTIEVHADPADDVLESDETDNVGRFVFGVGEPNLRAGLQTTAAQDGLTVEVRTLSNGEDIGHAFDVTYRLVDMDGIVVDEHHATLPGAAGGASIATTFGPFAYAPGAYVVEAHVDSGRAILERDESDNLVRQFIFIEDPFVDLTVSHDHPSAVPTLGVLQVDVAAFNGGNVGSSVTRVRLEVFDVDGGLVFTDERDLGPLCAACQTGTAFSATLPDGTYDVVSTIDPQDEVAESDEGSNTFATSVAVGGSGQPDLVVASWTHEPDPATPDEPITIFLDVANQGQFSAEASELALFVLFADGSFEQFAQIPIEPIGPGGTVPVEMFLGFLPSGVYHLFAEVDATATNDESDEGNNGAEHVLVVGGDAEAPDLVATAAVLGELVDGETLTLVAQARNDGSGQAGFHTMRVFLDGDLVGEFGYEGLDVGETVEQRIAVPATPGAHVLSVVADALDETFESDEANNVVTLSFFVNESAALPSDLSVTILGVERAPARTDLGDVGPSPLGRRIIEVAACNVGEETLAAGGQVSVSVLADAYKAGATTGAQLATFEVPELEGGECVTFHARWDPAGSVGDVTVVAEGVSDEDAGNRANDSDTYADFVLAGGYGGIVLL